MALFYQRRPRAKENENEKGEKKIRCATIRHIHRKGEIVTDRQHHVCILSATDTGRFREDSFFLSSVRDAAASRNLLSTPHKTIPTCFFFYLSTQLATSRLGLPIHLPTLQSRRVDLRCRCAPSL